MQDIFRDCIDKFVIIYLDDLLIFSSSRQEHITHVKTVLQRLRQNNLYAKQEKCSFFQASVEFLGVRVSSTGLSMA